VATAEVAAAMVEAVVSTAAEADTQAVAVIPVVVASMAVADIPAAEVSTVVGAIRAAVTLVAATPADTRAAVILVVGIPAVILEVASMAVAIPAEDIPVADIRAVALVTPEVGTQVVVSTVAEDTRGVAIPVEVTPEVAFMGVIPAADFMAADTSTAITIALDTIVTTVTAIIAPADGCGTALGIPTGTIRALFSRFGTGSTFLLATGNVRPSIKTSNPMWVRVSTSMMPHIVPCSSVAMPITTTKAAIFLLAIANSDSSPV
jgi:hypothetical protein